MLKKKEVRVCNYCRQDIVGEYIKTEDVPNEGYSTISWSKKGTGEYGVGDQDYCGIECLLADIRRALEGVGQ